MSKKTYRELSEIAIEIARRRGMPLLWYPFEFVAALNGVMVRGGEFALVTRGPRKGQPNYKKRLKPRDRDEWVVVTSDME